MLPNITEEKTSNFTTEEEKVYVRNALFQNLQNGAISYKVPKTNKKMLIELSNFLHITNTINRGAVIIEKGECVVNKVCAIGCYSTFKGRSEGQFLYTSVTNEVSKKNDVIDSSICSCKEENYMGHGPLYLMCAKIYTHTVNLTDNVCSYFPGMYQVPIAADANTGTIKFCTMRNDIALTSEVINFDRQNAKHTISHSNIINNTQLQNVRALIVVDGPTTIEHTSFLDNDKDRDMFYGRSGEITLIDCTIDADLVNCIIGNVIWNEITPSDDGKSFINALKHTENDHCLAQFDFFGSLTPDFGFPNNLCSKKPDHVNNDDDDMNIKSSKRRIFEYIFVVSCLNVDPSVGLWDEKE